MAQNSASDPVRAAQQLALLALTSQTRVLRRHQRRLAKAERAAGATSEMPDGGFTEQIANMARSVSTLTAEIRKSGKDMRETGKKWKPGQARHAIVAYLRALPVADRKEIIGDLGAEVLDG